MQSSKERNTKIDFIRGLAIILVICGHSVGLVMRGNSFDVKIGQVIYEIIYTFHMPLFFMISGYIAGNGNHSGRKDKFSSVVIKNVISLYIPYLFLNYIYWFERLLADKLLGINLERPLKISVKEMIELCYIGDGISWFLLSLLLIKLLFEILDRHVPEFVAFAVFSLLFWLDLGSVTNFLAWGIFYFIGHLIGKYKIDQISWGGRSRSYQFYLLISS